MDGQSTTGKRRLGRAMGLPLLILACLLNLFLMCLRYPDARLNGLLLCVKNKLILAQWSAPGGS